VARWVVDTNVLIVASAADPSSPFAQTGTHVPIVEQEAVFRWVQALRKEPDDVVVIDMPHRLIPGEYANKLSKDDYGRRVMMEKLSRGECEFAEVDKDVDGHGVILGDAGAKIFDLQDRKMVAAAEASGAPIANACDTDWCQLEQEGVLAELNVTVTHLLDAWIWPEYKRMCDEKKK
jgi:hypothetical protein